MHLAVKANDIELLKFLETLENIDFDMGDIDGETPLISAISKEKDDLARFLIDKGANMSHRTLKNNWTPIYVAACLGTIEMLEFLIGKGADVNSMTKLRRTALTKACWMGRTDSVRILLKHPHILIDHKANDDRTALHMSVWGCYGGMYQKKMGSNPKDCPDCARLLLEAGADPNSRDIKGKTPLHTAA